MQPRDMHAPLSPLALAIVKALYALGAGHPDGWRGSVKDLVGVLRETTGRGARPAYVRLAINELLETNVATEYRRGNFSIFRLSVAEKLKNPRLYDELSTELSTETSQPVDNGANHIKYTHDVMANQGGANHIKHTHDVYYPAGANHIKTSRGTGLKPSRGSPLRSIGGGTPLPEAIAWIPQSTTSNMSKSTFMSVDDVTHDVIRATRERARLETAPMTDDELKARRRALRKQLEALPTGNAQQARTSPTLSDCRRGDDGKDTATFTPGQDIAGARYSEPQKRGM